MHRMCRIACLLVFCLVPRFAWAEAAAFIALGTGARPLVDMGGGSALQAPVQSASLFSGPSRGSLFAPLPKRAEPNRPKVIARLDLPQIGGWQAARIFDVIAKAEAGRAGYDAVQYGATIRPAKPPTQMSLREIYAWIDETPGQPHAIGRYQFIPPTLRSLVKRLKIPLDARFSPEVQDKLAFALLEEAGFSKIQEGSMTRRRFMRNLARIWAGLPLPTGLSYYQGYAGNKATMSWAVFDREMQRIFPS